MKRNILYWPLLLLILCFLVSCTSQGRLTFLDFEESHDYEILAESIEALKDDIESGSTDSLFRALKSLRYLSKYADDVGKQEMAVETLVFLAAFSDDGDVEEQAESRLDAILSGEGSLFWPLNWILSTESWDPALRLAVIQYKAQLVSGEIGIFDDEVFEPADSNAREDALEFLIDRFVELEPLLQIEMVHAFERILLADVITDTDERSFQLELKQMIWDAAESWLGDEDPNLMSYASVNISKLTKRHILELASRVAPAKLFQWGANKTLSLYVREVAAALRERSSAETTDQIDLEQLNLAPDELLITHLAATLKQNDSEASDPSWIFEHGSTDNPNRADIIINAILQASNEGFLVKIDSLADSLEKRVEQAKTTEEQQRVSMLLKALYPSFSGKPEALEPVLTALQTQIQESKETLTQRIYVASLVDAAAYVPTAKDTVQQSLKHLDILTQHRISSQIQKFQIDDSADSTEVSPKEENSHSTEEPQAERPDEE